VVISPPIFHQLLSAASHNSRQILDNAQDTFRVFLSTATPTALVCELLYRRQPKRP
jgi:hypothetical protein